MLKRKGFRKQFRNFVLQIKLQMFKLPKSGFIRNTTTLLTGNVISQLVAFLIIPIIANKYTPAQFGYLALFMSFVTLLRIVSTARYDYAIIIADSQNEANALLRLATKINALFSTGLLAFIFLGKLLFPQLSYFQELGWFVYLIPFMVFLAGFCTSCSYYLNKKKEYSAMARADVSISVSISGMKLGFGFVRLTEIGLILASFIGQLVGSVYYFIKVGRSSFRRNELSLKTIAKKHSNFPLYILPKELIHNFSSRLPFLLLVVYFGSELLGYYSMATMLLLTPLGLIVTALTRVLYQRFADNVKNRETIIPFYKKYMSRIILCAVPAFILLFFLIKPAFSLLFADNWSNSIVYIQIIIPWMLIYFIASPFDFVPNIFGKQQKAVLFDIIYFVLCLTGLCIGIYFESFQLAIILFSTAGIINFTFLLFWYSGLLLKYEKERV